MLIAISQRNEKSEFMDYSDRLENNYINYYESFGIILIQIPNSSKKIEKYFKELSINGVILTGGGDVNPKLYEQKAQYVNNFSELRDNTESSLLEIAIEKKLPVFCNCRGMQFVNVFFGGNLIQDTKKQLKLDHLATNHIIKITDEKVNSYLKKDDFLVNSFHNQAITQEILSKELKYFAISEDGLIEGIYHPNYPIAGVQWHPERKGPDRKVDNMLINAFIKRELFWEKK
jgi:putative glutamine amidotransferase